MKPIKLLLSAIGPYADTMPEIDFRQFEKNKPLLIAGETGAGKTMIFDAICFALFDTASGSYRGTDNLRSEYAQPGTESYVDFYFSHQGRNYHVYRQPSYIRPARNKAGFKLEKEKAVFYQEGEVPIEGIKAVNTAVRELLHVDEKQFKQLAMIAQGEFWGLLNAKTEARTDILRNIFQTDGYKSMEQQLRDLKSKSSRRAAELERSIIQYFNEAEAEPGTELAAELDAVQAGLRQSGGLHGAEEMLELLDRLQAEDEGLEAVAAARLARLGEESLQFQKDLTLAESSAHNLRRYEELTKAVSLLREELDRQVQQEGAFERENAELSAKISRLGSSREELREVPEQLLLCQQELKELQELQQRIAGLFRREMPRYGEAGKRLEELQGKLVEAQALYEQAMQRKIAGENQLERNRAGILAQKLRAGEPCPVCGAVQHPSPAALPQKAATEAEVRMLRQEEKRRSEAKARAAAEAAAGKAELDTMAQAIGRNMKECLESRSWAAALRAEELPETKLPASCGLQELYELLLMQAKQLAEVIEARKSQAGALVHKKNELLKIDRELAAARGSETEQLEQRKQSFAVELAKAKAALADKEGQLALLEQLVKESGTTPQEAGAYKELLQQKLRENTKLLEDAQRRQGQIGYRKKNNSACRKKIAEQQKEFAEASHESHIMTRLFNLVSGQTGNGKLTLEQYVQAAGFDSIIRAANRRLGPMSDGRYELYRQEKSLGNKSHTYLDLEVLDNYTGHRRSVRNLSGGESFKASLSLALGLSDKVSSELGGICMDALFIDEGFGTLDKKSIEKAMEILLGLSDSNKLVAVISHREELMEAISQQLRVIKTRNGSSLKIVH